MKIILTQTIEPLGIIGSEVTVADGYARNYLLPQNKAVKANNANRKIIEQQKVKFNLQIAKEKTTAKELAAKLDGFDCAIVARVNHEGQLYGSVTSREIVKAMAEKGIELHRNMVLLTEPVKSIGTYQIPIRIYKDVETQITLEVQAEAKIEAG